MKSSRTRSNKQRDQTNIKQITHFAQHHRHHAVALEAQISRHSRNEKTFATSLFMLNECLAQNGTILMAICVK
jgi:hypothetical protein